MLMSIILIAIFVAILIGLRYMKSSMKKSFNFRVLTALVIGLIFGLFVQLAFGSATTEVVNQNGEVVTDNYVMYEELGITGDQVTQYLGEEAANYQGIYVESQDDLADPVFVKEQSTATGTLITFMSIFSGIYLNLLKLIVIPLILVSITTAIINARGKTNLGKKVTKIITWLLITVSISAVIGVATSLILGIDGAALVEGAQGTSAVIDRTTSVTERATTLSSMNFADFILAPIPSDFSFLVGQGDTAALSTVLFGMFLGYGVLQIDKRKPEKVAPFITGLNATKEVILSMVREILKLTPFAIVALMASFTATTTLDGMSQIVLFVIGTYVAIIIMYIIHLLILAAFGLNPIQFAKKTFPVILFGFGSRSSMAALTLNTRTQQDELGVDEVSADLSSTFSVTIGQNGCAGIYPAMVAVMAMQAAGNEITFGWLIMLVIVIAISSFGIAGVGGGATFAAIAVLSIMGLDVTMAAILISVEPLLDMARTALNISDGMLVGTIVSKMDKEIDMETYNG